MDGKRKTCMEHNKEKLVEKVIFFGEKSVLIFWKFTVYFLNKQNVTETLRLKMTNFFWLRHIMANIMI